MIYAEVIGDPIAQSKSPAIHNFWLEKLGIDAEYRACHIRPEALADYLATRRTDPDWRGCNVTMPHKQAVMPLLGKIAPPADTIGAVNTILPTGGGALAGTNTDAAGFLEPAGRVRPCADAIFPASTRIIGTGGAARRSSLRWRAKASRWWWRAAIRARRGRCSMNSRPRAIITSAPRPFQPIRRISPSTTAKAALTSSSMPPASGCRANSLLAFDWSRAPPGSIAYDIVTAPPDTPFLHGARDAGHRTIDGLAMLIGQAAVAFEKFFGQPARARMMPNCGSS